MSIFRPDDLPRWDPPPACPMLGDRQVHIWRLSLCPGQSAQARRSLLTEYLRPYLIEGGDSQTRITLEQNDDGKPYLPQSPLEFNWSHSGNVALLAVTRLAPLGIDLEILRPCRHCRAIARRFFTLEDQSFLELGRPSDQLDQRFLHLWTRYEAEVKARGSSIFAKTNRTPAPDPAANIKENIYRYSFQPFPQSIATLVILTQEQPTLLFFADESPHRRATGDL